MVCCRCRADPEKAVVPGLSYAVVVFDFISLVLGLLYIIGGVAILSQKSGIASDGNFAAIWDIAIDLAYFAIAAGLLCIVTALFGIAAAIRHNISWLKFYQFILIMMMTLNVVVGIVFLIYSGKVTSQVTTTLGTTFVTSYQSDSAVQLVMDALQADYACCGIQDYTDWNSNAYFNCTASTSSLACTVPASCCINYYILQNGINQQCSGAALNSTTVAKANIYTNGCRASIISLAQSGIKWLAACLIGVTLLFLANVILLVFLIAQIKKEKALHHAKLNYSKVDEEDTYLN